MSRKRTRQFLSGNFVSFRVFSGLSYDFRRIGVCRYGSIALVFEHRLDLIAQFGRIFVSMG